MAAVEDPKDASKEFNEFLDELIQKPEVSKASNTYNITGKSAAHVMAILKSIVNNKKRYIEDEVFTFNIGNPPTISFSLKAHPKPHQPGNGVIYRADPPNEAYKYDKDFIDQLHKEYPSSTREFAQHIKLVFKNNSELLKFENNKIIQHVYFLLLFEIGRRLVKDEESSTSKKRDFDNLRISEAITKIVKLFENEACRFEDVFLKGGEYHCFSVDPETRRDAIRRLLELQVKDLKELFYEKEEEESSEEEEEESSEGTTSTDSESSQCPVSIISRDLKDSSLSGRLQSSNKD